MAFALLSHLRYLSLKGNSFTVFPDVVSSRIYRGEEPKLIVCQLTIMPSL